MKKNGRSAERYSLYEDLRIRYEGHAREIAIRAPDLSTRGMFINTAEVFPEGAVLRTSFVLPRTGVRIQTRAEVRYCLPAVGIGIEFIRLDPEQTAAIERELSTWRAVPVTPPATALQ